MKLITARRAVPLAAGLLALAGCADPDADPAEAGADPADAGAGDQQRYEVAATVLESPEHGPQLCSAVEESLPPHCGGPDIVGWDWETVEAESAGGTTWGEYVLVGTWDGERFTLTDPAVAGDGSRVPDEDEDPFASPCPAPDGGWQPVDPATATEGALEEALARAATAPDYAGAWVDQSYLADVDEADIEELGNDPTRLVLNLQFTGDLAEREQWIREVWGGALCVTGAAHTEAELRDIQQQVHEDLPDVQSSGVDVVANVVTAQVFVATPELQQQVDDAYGEGTVVLDGWLTPVR
jgi:hypothetical protein